jgi:hypothetical protein
MSSSRAGVDLHVGRLAVTFVFLADCHREPPPSVHREPATSIEASAPVASTSVATIAIETPTPPPATAGCRHAVTPGIDLAHVSDATLRELILGGAPGPKRAKDCIGQTVEYDNPVPATVKRYATSGTHMAVFVTVAKEQGYMDWFPGFVAIVRLDHDEIVTEGVGPQSIDDSVFASSIEVVMLDGHRALLFPHVMSTGETGDFESAWTVSLADDHGALHSVGKITSTRSIGNGSIMSGEWFGGMDATVRGGGPSIQVEERWDFVRETDGGEEHGKKQTLVRSYSLADGKLVMSPKGNPRQ